MKKELLILMVVVSFSLLTYWLVEPFAHSQMHAHVESNGFKYDDLPKMTKVGRVEQGKDLFNGAGACMGCHSIKSQGVPAMMDANTAASTYGVNPPDLSKAGAIYDGKFLASLIKNPAHALNVEHKYPKDGSKMHPMTSFYGAGGDIEQEVADIVAYLVKIAPEQKDITRKEAFENACGRCHAMRYKQWTQIGEKKAFKYKKDELRFDADVLEYQEKVTKYMGKLPPDLSMYFRSRGENYITTFIEDPQSHLKGTAMPRVGVNEDAAKKVVEYMEEAADPKKEERETVGMYVMLYMLVFIIFAYLWKRQVWKYLH